MCFAWAAAAFAVAQVAQGLIERRLKVGQTSSLLDLLPIVHADNHGASFGFLASRGSALVALNVLAGVCLLAWIARIGLRRPLLAGAVGLIAGGGTANLADRLVSAHVTDYLRLPYTPVFNLADVFILTGIMALLVSTAVEQRSRIGA